ncbi:hypothetical protein EVG20_g2002 [Dentipellis fragilis]|uniref:Uncharacterized protein n=1 Tax=Dentipellis fragilis TaxID=205917 RepID=A0A4Y9Z804_9AGAM|nr:hypothetical protein EVG20_g2002 [Dentipellis fragilis]
MVYDGFATHYVALRVEPTSLQERRGVGKRAGNNEDRRRRGTPTNPLSAAPHTTASRLITPLSPSPPAATTPLLVPSETVPLPQQGSPSMVRGPTTHVLACSRSLPAPLIPGTTTTSAPLRSLSPANAACTCVVDTSSTPHHACNPASPTRSASPKRVSSDDAPRAAAAHNVRAAPATPRAALYEPRTTSDF